jgi:hypothetical protein
VGIVGAEPAEQKGLAKIRPDHAFPKSVAKRAQQTTEKQKYIK